MKEYTVGPADAGQRLDKYLRKILKEADSGFLYRMLRKKNITLNGKKAEGGEKLSAGDTVLFFLSDETFEKFRGEAKETVPSLAWPASLSIVYEDDCFLFVNKPAGMLSQKRLPEDISLCEYIDSYLAGKGVSGPVGTVNRLDRNTSGLTLTGKTVAARQLLSRLLKERELEKYYLAVAAGKAVRPERLVQYWVKDEKTNQVSLSDRELPGSSRVELAYRPEESLGDYTLLKIRLISGKSHQIRAQLASRGLPVLGDAKYGDQAVNRRFEAETGHPLRHQLLHAYEAVFPAEFRLEEGLSPEAAQAFVSIAGKRFTAPLPPNFRQCVRLLGGEYHGR